MERLTEKTVVFEGVSSWDPREKSYEIYDMYIMGDKVIASIIEDQNDGVKVLAPGVEGANWQHIRVAIFDIAPDGSFINMHELVLDE